jgi:ferredoxin-NADP reductase
LERLAAARVPVTWRVTTVSEVVDETPNAKTLVLDAPGWPGHLAGQHVDVRLTADDGYQAERSYSIASSPLDPRLALTVERIADGEVSSYLVDGLRPGDPLELRGPIGGYFTWQPADGGPLLLLAGGSGLVPLMAMLRHRADAQSTVEARLLVSSRTSSDVLYRDELAQIASAGVDVHVTLTREQPPDWAGWSGRVDLAMLRDLGTDPAQRPRAFVCGPTGFVEHAAALLLELGLEPHAVKTERFGPTGSGA